MNQFIVLTKEEFKSILDDLEYRISGLINQSKSEDLSLSDFLTPVEVATLFKVSLQTVHTWSNQGILVKHKIGRKTRFKKEEVLSALTQLETKKSKSWKR